MLYDTEIIQPNTTQLLLEMAWRYSTIISGAFSRLQTDSLLPQCQS